jgi:virulence-associated protein VapD
MSSLICIKDAKGNGQRTAWADFKRYLKDLPKFLAVQCGIYLSTKLILVLRAAIESAISS